MSDHGRRHIEKHGHTIVLKTWAQGGKDSWGDATLTATEGTIKAIQDMRIGRAGDYQDASGAIPTGAAIFYTSDPVTATLMVGTVPTLSTMTVSDGGATQASEFVDDEVTYTVIQKDKLDNGILVMIAERNRA